MDDFLACDLTRQRWKRTWMAAGTLASVIAAVLIFHFFVMDLDVLWAKVMRKVDF